MPAQIEAFLDPASSTYSYVVYEADGGQCAIVDPVLDVWKALPPREFPNYASGSWGPAEADEMLERDGRAWKNILA